MDNRLKLTRKQKGLVKRLRKLFYELEKENVGVMVEYSDFDLDGLIFYNASEVYDTDDFDFDDYDGEVTENYIEESVNETADEDTIWYVPDPGDVERLVFDSFIGKNCCCGNNWFSVLLDRDERVDEFYRRKAKQEKLKAKQEEQALLVDKMNKSAKEIEVYEQAIISCEDTIKMLEDKKVEQKVIDEEYAQIASNKTRINELQKEISELSKEITELNKEIRKVKAIKIKKRKNVQNDVVDKNSHIEDDVENETGHYEDFVDEDTGEVVHVWVEAPNSKK